MPIPQDIGYDAGQANQHGAAGLGAGRSWDRSRCNKLRNSDREEDCPKTVEMLKTSAPKPRFFVAFTVFCVKQACRRMATMMGEQTRSESLFYYFRLAQASGATAGGSPDFDGQPGRDRNSRATPGEDLAV